MTGPEYDYTPVGGGGLVRDLLAALLIVLAVAGYIYVGFSVDPLAGIAVVCTVLLASGVTLGLNR